MAFKQYHPSCSDRRFCDLTVKAGQLPAARNWRLQPFPSPEILHNCSSLALLQSDDMFSPVANRDANKKGLEQIEKATDSEPVKGKELLESEELKRQLSEAEERLRSGLSPKKAKSKSH
jgi:hypothetical protein